MMKKRPLIGVKLYTVKQESLQSFRRVVACKGEVWLQVTFADHEKYLSINTTALELVDRKTFATHFKLHLQKQLINYNYFCMLASGVVIHTCMGAGRPETNYK